LRGRARLGDSVSRGGSAGLEESAALVRGSLT